MEILSEKRLQVQGGVPKDCILRRLAEKPALMKQLRYKAVEQTTLSSP